MRVSARVMPKVRLSGLSGRVRRGRTVKSLDSQGMAGFVRSVRRIFHCLTYAHARVVLFSFSTRGDYLFPWDSEKNRTSRTAVLTERIY